MFDAGPGDELPEEGGHCRGGRLVDFGRCYNAGIRRSAKMVEIYNDDRTEKRVANTNPTSARDVTAQLN